MGVFVECTETFTVEFVTTVAGDLYRANLTCALGQGHENVYHWDPRGFYWLPYQGGVLVDPPLLAGAGAQAGDA